MGNSAGKAANPTNKEVQQRVQTQAGESVTEERSSSKLTKPSSIENSFHPLSQAHRALTFDDRRKKREQAITLGGNHEFKPLKRAATFDSRRSDNHFSNPLNTVDDVLHRRYFNLRATRDSKSKAGLYRISETFDQDALDKQTVVVVDPYSTGMVLAQQLMDRGYSCISVISDTSTTLAALVDHIPKELQEKFTATIFHVQEDETDHLSDTLKAINELNTNIVAVFPGAESGVLLADKLSEALGVLTNGTAGSAARRNKYLMGEKIRKAGLRAVKQCSATKWSEIVDFIENDLKPTPFEVIVKPVMSAGSDDVRLCRSMDEVKIAFGNIQGKINGLGIENTSTLVQEYLRGTEYVVDTVSRDGVRKVTAVWEYDKRAANGADFVYYGVILRPVSGPIISQLVSYILKVLDALEITHGPGHAEVKFVNGEPCLVEIGSRCHGGSGSNICILDECIGYNQVQLTIDSYLDVEKFKSYPDAPTTLLKYGAEKMLVTYEHGRIIGIPGMKEVHAMKSFLGDLMGVKVGDVVAPTVDMFTTPGSIMLVHEDEATLNNSYDRLLEMEKAGLFELEPLVRAKITRKVVAVVDPFSTGAVLAHKICERGLECICVYSNTLENMEGVASLVPEGLTLAFAATVGFEGDPERTAKSLRKTLKTLGASLEAIIPGAETGVLLADKLADIFGTRANDIRYSSARRNKYEMGETLRLAGIRAVMQTKATDWEQAKKFIDELAPNPFQVVLKPLESAGTDDVVLCLSMDQAHDTFNRIFGKINGLGLKNEAVLVQEFLEGTEYVVDTVSRDGEHKVVSVWQYDKRPVNNSAFVYFNMTIIPVEGVVRELIEYIRKVITVLGIKNGPAHSEVKFCRGEAVLIETGARCHGGEGNWIPIALSCVGQNQVDATVSAFLFPEEFTQIPSQPSSLKKYGCEVMMVSFTEGIVESIPGLDIVSSLKSFVKKDFFIKEGDMIKVTIDCFTTPGSVILIHENEQQLLDDVNRIRELEQDGFFILK